MGTIVLMFIASLFQTIEGPAYNAIIADITPLEERDKAYSLQYSGANLGLVLSPTLSGLLFKNYLWLAFIISGVAIGCSTILIWFFVRDITPVEMDRAEYQRARDGESILRSSARIRRSFCILPCRRCAARHTTSTAISCRWISDASTARTAR